MNHIIEELNQGIGYSQKIVLSNQELTRIRELIENQWLYRLQLLSPENIFSFQQSGIENYHQLAYLIDHQKTWFTSTRVLPKFSVAEIKKMPFYNELKQNLGFFEIADEEKFGWENMLWRLVRPGNTDCGSIHADQWIWDLAENPIIPTYAHQRINIWIAIHTVPGKNGLLVAPKSQKRSDWKWHTETRYDLIKPVLDESLKDLNLTLLNLNAGEGVIFHHSLLHGGAANQADVTRVSLEFTVLVPT